MVLSVRKEKIYNSDCDVIISKSLSFKSTDSASHFSNETPVKKEVNVSSSILGIDTVGDVSFLVLHSSPEKNVHYKVMKGNNT